MKLDIDCVKTISKFMCAFIHVVITGLVKKNTHFNRRNIFNFIFILEQETCFIQARRIASNIF